MRGAPQTHPPSSLRLGTGGENETCFLWEALPAGAQAQLYTFAVGLQGEDNHKKEILKGLRRCARELFVTDNVLLVEELCIKLGYIEEAYAGKLYEGQQQVQFDPIEL